MAQNSLIRYAEQQEDLGNYHRAAEVYSSAFGKKETYLSAKGAAQSYEKLNDYAQAFDWWGKAMSFDEYHSLSDAESYLRIAYALGRQDQVAKELGRVGYQIETDERMMLASQHTTDSGLQLEYMGELNSSNAADFMVEKDGDGNLYFVSDRESVAGEVTVPGLRFDAKNKVFDKKIYEWTGREYFKIYRKDTTGAIQEIQIDQSDFLHISDPSILEMGDKTILFFSATRNIRKVKRNKDFSIHPEIFYGTLDNEGILTNYQSFPYNDALVHGMITPFADSNAKRLYFASDMAGGLGGFDVYYVNLTDGLDFSQPVNLGSTVNSPGNERDPFVYDNILYFASDGHEGFGGFDIFRADSNGDGKFFNRVHLEAPINSSRDDFAYRRFADGEIYLSSNRLGDSGLDNIYRLTQELRQLLVRVIDCRGDLVTDADLRVAAADGGTVEMTRNEKGEYLGDLSADTDYGLSLSKGGHFGVEDPEITTRGMDPGVLEKEYRLIRIPRDMTVYTDIIYYDLDRSEIRRDAGEILSTVSVMMKKYEFLDLRVSSHTDSRASKSYNTALSQRRAEAVLASLKGDGVSGERISLEWHGEDRLAVDCPDGVDCPEDSHQLNRRSELLLSIVLREGTVLPEGFMEDDWCNETGIAGKIQEEVGIPTVYFDFDRHDLRLSDRMELERLALLLRHNEGISLKLEGHTDIRGSEAYNQALSERRADVVRKYLVDRKVSESRLEYEWFGKSRPAQDCDPCSTDKHQLNRRTEIKVKR